MTMTIDLGGLPRSALLRLRGIVNDECIARTAQLETNAKLL